MALPNVQYKFNKKNSESVVTYCNRACELLFNQWTIRPALEYIDQQYMREGDNTKENVRAVIANAWGDKTRYQNLTVPIVMPQVEAAVGYLSQVFLTGYPIFGVAASPAYADAALMMETIIANNATMTGWAGNLIKFFRDGLKYNLAAVEVDWCQLTAPNFETDLNAPGSVKAKDKVWSGNRIKHLNMYNTVFDPRVPPVRSHIDGEFSGYVELYSRIKMKKFVNDLYGTVPAATAIRAFESGLGLVSGLPQWMGYFMPNVNRQPMRPFNATSFDWMSWAGGGAQDGAGVRYQNMYEVFTMYARILPSDFDLQVPEANTPQIWKFIVINRQVLLYAERMTNAHQFLPILISQPLDDGLEFQTKSFAQNVIPMQDLASAHWNADIASKRRLVTDRVLYDPSRIKEKDINSSNPAAKIPVRPAAYGKPVGDAVYAFPFKDEQAQTLVMNSDAIVRFANLINGQNPAQQGQFVKGNKTKKEFSDVMGHANNRNLLIALVLESHFFTPMKEMIKINILQRQDAADLYNVDKDTQVKIDPLVLRKAVLEFKMTDGILPADKILDSELLGTTIQVLGSSPQLASEYQLGPMFSYFMKQQGLNLRPFEKSAEQKQYEQAMGTWNNALAMLLADKSMAEKGVEELKKILGPMPQPPVPGAEQKTPEPTLQQAISAAAGAG